MTCPECKIEMVEGIVTQCILSGNVTLSHVAGVIRKCMKCPICGHSEVNSVLMETRK